MAHRSPSARSRSLRSSPRRSQPNLSVRPAASLVTVPFGAVLFAVIAVVLGIVYIVHIIHKRRIAAAPSVAPTPPG